MAGHFIPETPTNQHSCIIDQNGRLIALDVARPRTVPVVDQVRDRLDDLTGRVAALEARDKADRDFWGSVIFVVCLAAVLGLSACVGFLLIKSGMSS